MTAQLPLYPVTVAGVAIFVPARDATEAATAARQIIPAITLPADASAGAGDVLRLAAVTVRNEATGLRRRSMAALADQLDELATAADRRLDDLCLDLKRVETIARDGERERISAVLHRLRYGARLVNPST